MDLLTLGGSRVRAALVLFASLGAWLGTEGRQQVSQGPADEDLWAWHRAEYLRFVIADPRATPDDVLRAAGAELALGRGDRARRLLESLFMDSILSPSSRVLARLGDASVLQGQYDEAGGFFARAARGVVGVQRGIWHARAGDAYERGGRFEEAVVEYRAARRALPMIEGWLAIREARSGVRRAAALALLDRAPPEAARLVARVRGRVLLARADSAGAQRAFADAADDTAAAQIALARGDMAGARRFAYAALEASDSTTTAAGYAIVARHFPPGTGTELVLTAQALKRLRRPGDGARLIAAAIRAGDSSASLLLAWGELLEEANRLPAALAAYRRGGRAEGQAGQSGRYRYARLLVRMGRRGEGYAALLRFAEEFPEHVAAPLAVYLVAENRERAGRAHEADSLYRAVASGWPRDLYGSRARVRLASLALERGDSAAAEGWHRAEIAVDGPQRSAAEFLSGRLRAAAGDSAGARTMWTQLVRRDSLGYYGAAARAALGLPVMRFAPPSRAVRSTEVRVILQRLDLLRAALPGGEEVAEFVGDLVRHPDRPLPDLLAVAAELIQRGWVSEGVRLGWEAVRRHTLHDERILRVIYPWPLRELIETEGRKFGLDPYLLAALIRQESTFLSDVTSRAGARGLMQLMPATAAQVARNNRLTWNESLLAVPDANLHVGAAHLAALFRRYGDAVGALAAYNAGGRPVSRWLRYPEARDPYLFVERIPYIETRNYVKIVLRNRVLYRALYPGAADDSGAFP